MKLKLAVCFVFAAVQTYANEPQMRVYHAQRIASEPRIDGRLDDAVWLSITPAEGFTQFQPNPGTPSEFETEVKLAYSNTALYVAAKMHESNPSKISRELTRRDTWGQADYFMLGLDPFFDRQSGLRFGVTAAGVQIDMKLLPWCVGCSTVDISWDAVWESAVAVIDDGWSVEMRIPYSALRFPKQIDQTWGVQFSRYTSHAQETATWSPMDPKTNGVSNQWGRLSGIANIDPPLRLSLSPYVATYYERLPLSTKPVSMHERLWFNGGMDLKYGITESFTLDMTLVPDFGQVQSDNVILNLGPFEQRHEEHRPFFTEGTELFNTGGLFYSRRIGRTPSLFLALPSLITADEEVVSNPGQVRLYNATKLSGRTKSNLGVGVFNAVAAPAYATVRNTGTGEQRRIETEPLTNYNLVVFRQSLRNNAHIGFANANTLRQGAARDANASAITFNVRDNKNRYDLNGSLKSSYVVELDAAPSIGYAYGLGFSKVSGNLKIDLAYTEDNEAFDPNDLGLQFQNNERAAFVGLMYDQYEPKGIYNRWHLWFGNPVSWRLEPGHFQSYKPNAGGEIVFKNNWAASVYLEVAPFGFYDFYEPRVAHRKYRHVQYVYTNLSLTTDERKRVFLFGVMAFAESPIVDDPMYELRLRPSFRLSDRCVISHEASAFVDKGNFGFVQVVEPDSVQFGRRRIERAVNTLSVSYNVSPKLSCTFRARHYWTQLAYASLHHLNPDGTLAEIENGPDPSAFNTNFDAFNVDAVITWQFAPGSFMTLTWKNAAIHRDNDVRFNYFDNARHTWETPKSNQVSLKAIYYLDYLAFKKG